MAFTPTSRPRADDPDTEPSGLGILLVMTLLGLFWLGVGILLGRFVLTLTCVTR